MEGRVAERRRPDVKDSLFINAYIYVRCMCVYICIYTATATANTVNHEEATAAAATTEKRLYIIVCCGMYSTAFECWNGAQHELISRETLD